MKSSALHPNNLSGFSGPLDVITSLLSKSNQDPDRSIKVNDSIMADALGEPPIPPPPSDLPGQTIHLMHTTLNLYSCIYRFKIFENMFRRYPWRGYVSKTAHLESTFYLFAHETYILEERLKKYTASAETYARLANVPLDIKQIRKRLLAQHTTAFGKIVRMRGSHVHQDDDAPREIKRVRLLDTLSSSDVPEYRFLYSQALAQARTQWIENGQVAAANARTLGATAFNSTEIIWTTLRQEQAP